MIEFCNFTLSYLTHFYFFKVLVIFQTGVLFTNEVQKTARNIPGPAANVCSSLGYKKLNHF